MKKVLTLLFTSLLVFLMLVGPGNFVSAAQPTPGSCGCEEEGIFHVYGEEKNKIVANLLSSDVFKDIKLELFNSGYTWNGVNDIQVVQTLPELGGIIAITVPFINENGIPEVAVFVNGKFITVTSPPPTE